MNNTRSLVELALVLAILVMIVAIYQHAYGAELALCKAEPIGKYYWSWRLIDGRRCYYVGRADKPKSELHWGVTPVGTTAPSEAGQPKDGTTVAPAVLEAAPAPMRTYGAFDRAWQRTMEDLYAAPWLDPTPAWIKAR